jgi:hypothetical protein
MIRRRSWPAALLFLVICMTPAAALAQLSDNLSGLTDDDLEGYLSPLSTGLSGTMNAAIFRTGHVPKSGVNITGGLVIMAIGYDDEDRTYLPDVPEGFTSTPVPTVVGKPKGEIIMSQSRLARMYPGGFDLDGFELAAPQISIGSFMGTRALFRYIALDLGDSDIGNFSYFGAGAQHSISQWVPDLPVDLAAGFFVQNLDIGDGVVDANTVHVNVTASKDFTYVQPYAGFGFDSIKMNAEYDDEDDPEASFDVTLERETDPHLTLGVVGKVPFLSVFFEFNAAAATGIAVGLSLGR